MEKFSVLLVCGSGASSGFMAANIRKAVKNRGLDIEVVARSDAEIENYVDDIEIIMVGPHMAFIMDELEEYKEDYDIKIALMKPEYYSHLDGEKALDHILSVYSDDEQ